MATLIVGSDGQDGQLMREFLSKKKLPFYALNRSCLQDNFGIYHPIPSSAEEFRRFLQKWRVSNIYFFAAISKAEGNRKLVPSELSGLLKVEKLFHDLISACAGLEDKIWFFFASSSLVFQDTKISPQDETTAYAPTEEYAITKIRLSAQLLHSAVAHPNLLPCLGILYPHESNLRQRDFLSARLFYDAINRLSNPRKDRIALYSSVKKIDFSYAPDFVNNMWVLCKMRETGSFIMASGTGLTIEEIVSQIYGGFGIDYQDAVLFEKDNSQISHFDLIGNPNKLLSLSKRMKSRTPTQTLELLRSDWEAISNGN